MGRSAGGQVPCRDRRGIARLKEYPELGKARDDVRPGYRSLRINEHIVYYTVTPSVIRIVRVLHVRMEPEPHL